MHSLKARLRQRKSWGRQVCEHKFSAAIANQIKCDIGAIIMAHIKQHPYECMAAVGLISGALVQTLDDTASCKIFEIAFESGSKEFTSIKDSIK